MNRSFFKKAAAVLLAGCMCVPLAACDRRGTGEGLSGTLNIMVQDAGYGVEWLDNLIEAFTDEYPEALVEYEAERLTDKITAELSATPALQQNDLYFINTDMGYTWATTKNMIPGVENMLVDMTDVYDYTPEGEDKTIREKMSPTVVDSLIIGDKFYYINFGVTSFGIMYNPAMLEGKTLPNTTLELEALAKQLDGELSGTAKPFVFSGSVDYWNQMFYTWWAQYQTVEGFDQFFSGKIDGEYSVEVFKQQGRLEAYKVVESLIGYGKYAADDCNDISHMSSETRFFGGEAAMMVNGGWLENEVDELYMGEIPFSPGLMKTPVISSIVDHCSTIEGEGGGTADGELSDLIAAIDAGSTALQGEGTHGGYNVNQDDFDRVYNARQLLYYAGEAHNAFIPTTGHNPELAKEFLKFMYSDKGVNAYLNACNGAVLPIEDFDYSNNTVVQEEYTNLQKQSIDQLYNSELFTIKTNTAVMNFGHSKVACKNANMEFLLSARNEADRMSAQEIFDMTYEYYNADDQLNWKNLLRAKGILVS